MANPWSPTGKYHVRGALVISLDLELFWGMRDVSSLGVYGPAIQGVRQAIPRMLELFRQYDVRTTIAVVGMLFFRHKDALTRSLPDPPVKYSDPRYDWYPDYFCNKVGISEDDDPYHFGASLVEEIMQDGRHELATHTFSHFYALEATQQADAFQKDLERAMVVADAIGVRVESIVFPRNQYDGKHLHLCKACGIRGFRGNESGWMYEPRSRQAESRVRRLARLVDSYVNLSGYHNYGWDQLRDPSDLFNIPASRFLRPFNARLKSLDGLRLRRITQAMSDAARRGRVYHLWWHPHNFGVHLDQNLDFLRSVLNHYKFLNDKYGFLSLTMSDCYHLVESADSAGIGEPASVGDLA